MALPPVLAVGCEIKNEVPLMIEVMTAPAGMFPPETDMPTLKPAVLVLVMV